MLWTLLEIAIVKVIGRPGHSRGIGCLVHVDIVLLGGETARTP